QIKKMEAADCPLMAEFLDYPFTNYYTFFQHKRGNFFILKANSDNLTYINTLENKKVVSRLPFNPGNDEFHWRSKLIPHSDTTFYITGHYSGFYKVRFYPESGALKLYPGKYFRNYLCTAIFKDKDSHLWIATNKGLFRQNHRKSLVQLALVPAGLEDS